MCKYNSLVTRVTSPCPHMGTVIYMTVMTVDGCSLLPIGLLLVGRSGHQCGCSIKYNCASCWRVLLATSRGCSLLGAPVTGAAAPKVGVRSCHYISGGCYQKVSCKGHGTPCPVSPQEHTLQLTRTNPTTNDLR